MNAHLVDALFGAAATLAAFLACVGLLYLYAPVAWDGEPEARVAVEATEATGP